MACSKHLLGLLKEQLHDLSLSHLNLCLPVGLRRRLVGEVAAVTAVRIEEVFCCRLPFALALLDSGRVWTSFGRLQGLVSGLLWTDAFGRLARSCPWPPVVDPWPFSEALPMLAL